MAEIIETGLVPQAPVLNIIENFNSASSDFVCSFDYTTDVGQKMMFNCHSDADFKLSDFVGKTIKVKDFYLHVVNLERDDGTREDCPRIIIFDDKGSTYGCVSWGVYNAVRNLFSMTGGTTFENPVTIEIKSKTLDSGKKTMAFKMI